MIQFSLLSATRAIEAAMPFVLYRFVVYLGLGLAYLLAALAGAGTLIAFASFAAKPGAVAGFGALLGLAGCAYLIHNFRASLFFNVRAGHLALLGEQAKGAKLPEGKAQIDFAKEAAARALSPALFVELNQAVGEVALSLATEPAGLLDRPAQPALASAKQWGAGMLARAAAQSAIALHFRNPAGNPWQAAETGLLLLARHFKPVLKFELYAVALELLGLIAGFAAMLYPVNSVASALPVDVGYWRLVFALVFAWSLKAAFFTPIAITAMAQTFFSLEQLPGDETETLRRRLNDLSPAFRAVSERAATATE